MDFSRNKFFPLIFALFLAACDENSSSVPEAFVHLYGDLRVASKEYGETSTDGKIARVQILEKYGYSAKQFDSIAEWIEQHPDAWNPFEEAVVAYVDSLAVSAGAIAPAKPNIPPKNPKAAK